MKKIEEDTTDKKIHHVLGLEVSTLLKSSYCPRQSIDSVYSYEIYNDIFHRTRKEILNFVWKHKIQYRQIQS